MFGLEGQKKKKPVQEFIFELEKEFKDPVKSKKIRQRIEMRIQKIKEVLRSGDAKEEFEHFGTLIHGYNSFIKVMTRSISKKK